MLTVALVLAAPSLCSAQFIDPAPQMLRLPPVWVESTFAAPPIAAIGTTSAIPSWAPALSVVAPVAYQSPGEPVVQSVPMPDMPIGPPTIPSVSSPRRYFATNSMPPRSGHITTGNAPPTPFAPDPEELDSCNLIQQHRRAMIDLMGRNELLISAGTVSPVGDSTIDNHLLTGWGIQGAVRHLWCSGTDTWMGFTEAGGGFWENGGNRSSVSTSGTLTDTTTGNTAYIALDDFFETTLRDLKRATVHAALGTYWMPAVWQQPGTRAVQFNGRIGLQWGHAHATYQQVASGDLQSAIASRIAQGSLPTALRLRSNAAVTDSYFGLLTSGGVAYTRYNVQWGCFELAEVAVGLDLQYTHDFINLRSYNIGSRGVSTLAPMASLRILY